MDIERAEEVLVGLIGGLREVLSESVLHPLLEEDCMQSVRDGRVTQLIMTGTSDVCCCRLAELMKMEWREMCTRRGCEREQYREQYRHK